VPPDNVALPVNGGGLRSRWLRLRERCLTSPVFHRFALAFPLTRPVVRKRQAELFHMVSGFVHSQVLLACLELDVLHTVRGEGATLAQIADLTGLAPDATRRLIEAARALRLLEADGELYRPGDLGAALIANPGVQAMVLHHKAFYADLGDPVALLRQSKGNTQLARYWRYATSDDPANSSADDVSAYSDLMAESQRMVVCEVLAAYDFSTHRRVLDMGGGQGVFLREVLNANPTLEGILFDLPAVASRAQTSFEQTGLSARVEVKGGSFFEGDMPSGADLVSLVRILHDHDDPAARLILKAAWQALQPGGKLLICEPMQMGKVSAHMCDVYFNFYLHAMGSGTPRSVGALREMALEAGFSRAKPVSTRSPMITGIIVCEK